MELKKYLQKDKLLLLSLRGISVVAKFLFTTLFFRFSEADFGEYSLVAVTILLLVYGLGMDFYSFANRELMMPNSDKQKIIFNQFLFYGFLYLLLFPVVYVIFHTLNFNPKYQLIFYLVLITEHLNYEFYRLLFVFKKPIAANINLFLRNGLWVLFATVLLFINKNISIEQVLKYWFMGDLGALLFSASIIFFKKHKIAKSELTIDTQWIKKGFLISIPYILGTISYKTIQFADRYMIDAFMDKKAVGIYSFFANMANVMNIVLFTLVISVLYPYLVEGVMENNRQKFDKYFKKFKKEIYLYSIAMIFILSLLLPIVLITIHKQEYLKDFYVFFLLALGNFFLNLSFLYHYIIYAYKKDWWIFYATIFGAIINILLNYLLIPSYGIGGASVATFVSFMLILLVKWRYAKKI